VIELGGRTGADRFNPFAEREVAGQGEAGAFPWSVMIWTAVQGAARVDLDVDDFI
jgi:hypothetical protein